MKASKKAAQVDPIKIMKAAGEGQGFVDVSSQMQSLIKRRQWKVSSPSQSKLMLN